ncbi:MULTISPECIES: hypothetical protein [unclassified Amycolatopsis]|uniref:hypothetical protein n=1 Tax=unclassified Amycolatopsis TaxID=2618356 RepID=UPI0028745997|nr:MULTISPECIES: hypothetical protein [unclassified Amycolatopsis]MDS0138010.1 hypothetical protein [Amycolatopsis sp. 505]MDS0144077.1 hypothetical protein [Amycolatopsis sp. CM201R]
MTTGVRKKNGWGRAALLLVLLVAGYFVGVGVAAVLGSAEPWSFGIIGIGPALAGFFADDLRCRVRGG